jgi:hypothetical protein
MRQQGQSLVDRAALLLLGHLCFLGKPTYGKLSVRFRLRAGSSVTLKAGIRNSETPGFPVVPSAPRPSDWYR